MSKLIVLYDAYVLYPAPLRDLLMHLALTDLFHAKWSSAIHEEWIRNVLKSRPDVRRMQLERTRNLMDSHVRDALVVGHEALIEQLILPDLNDRHVLAAAITSHSNLILTFNLKDFPATYLEAYKIKAQHPDNFIISQLIQNTNTVLSAVKNHRATLKKPPKRVDEYLEILERQGLPKTVAKLSHYRNII